MIAGALPVLTWTWGLGSFCVSAVRALATAVVAVVAVLRIAGFDSSDSRMRRPALNLTVLFAGTGTRSSVFGFWAMRGARCLTSKTPKSRNSRRFPSAISSMTISRNSWTICFATTLLWPVRCAIWSTRTFLVIVFMVFYLSIRVVDAVDESF